MKRTLIISISTLICFFSEGQMRTEGHKYPSVFWEITGNGLKKPSYLFGTMHVSSKIAFHLSDSFYVAIRSSDVIALETNPESWQADMNRYELPDDSYDNIYSDTHQDELPEDYLTIQSLRFDRYEKKLELALYSRPQVINNLLYRSRSPQTSDFEEDTYLDLYIYQTGKRLGKRVTGVEQYQESMRLMSEAFRDAENDKNKKDVSYNFDEEYSSDKLQDAYRTGNLDRLDSINRINSQSEAFDEKFLYKRNEIQAHSIDSILKSSTLFVGVGAAHLPGTRGVIELLRKKGYRLRPIFMSTRDSRQKEEIEKIRVPVQFSLQKADDGFYTVEAPGPLYQFDDNTIFDERQYADMANGSYYMVTRVKTNSLYWGHDINRVLKKLDSLLYENVPGKIVRKTVIQKNGYKGLDIINRTRRGDIQRYNIFITPFEVLFFKMSGNGDYVEKGDEAGKFFSSIKLKEFINQGWKNFEPVYGGFSVDFPQEPFESFGNNVQYDADDFSKGNHYSVIRTDIHNYNFAGEDNFDLTLMDESFSSSEFIKDKISSKQFVFRGYPALDCKYRDKDGSFIHARFIIQGAHYYTLLVHIKKDASDVSRFLNSFEIKPFVYKEPTEYADTLMKYSVLTSWYPGNKKEKIQIPDEYPGDSDNYEDFYGFPDSENFKSIYIKNDTTGESVFISYVKTPAYYYASDSASWESDNEFYFPGSDSSWIILDKKKTTLKNGTLVTSQKMSGKNSSRAFISKTWYKDGISYALISETDTLTRLSSFLKNFFENFSPGDTTSGVNPFLKKSDVFFDDLFSNDSARRNKAIRSVRYVEFDSTDLNNLSRAIASFQWSDLNYLEKKNSFIKKLASIPSRAATDLLKKLYAAAADTIQIQQIVLETMLKQQTQYTFNTFRDIVISDPPVIDKAGRGKYNTYSSVNIPGFGSNTPDNISNGNFMDELYDSLLLTKSILPDLLPLLNIDDYEWPLMLLLKKMVDSSLVSSKNYEIYFSKFLIEAKLELKKQVIEEKKSSIEKAEEVKRDINSSNTIFTKRSGDPGNERLMVYATLLLPSREKNPAVAQFFGQLLNLQDKRIKYNLLNLLLRNKQEYPDTLITYFAASDEYRFELYKDLFDLGMTEKFPSLYNNHRELSKSKLLSISYFIKPDSLLYLDSAAASYKDKEGWVYFYKYKQKKDDPFWKLACVGLIPKDPGRFLFDEDEGIESPVFVPGWDMYNYNKGGGFTQFTDETIRDNGSVKKQLTSQLKRLLYSKRKSAKKFFIEKPDFFSYWSNQYTN